MDKMIYEENNGIIYSINKDIELISIIMLLSPYYYIRYPYLKTSFSLEYINMLEKEFGKYKNHSIIKEFDKKAHNGFFFDKPLRSVLVDDNASDPFVNKLYSFSAESDYENFFNKHKIYFEKVLQYNLDKITEIDYKNMLTEYFGKEPPPMHVIFANTLGGCGFQISCIDKTYCVLGCFDIEDGIPIFVEQSQFSKMIIHEFLHGFVNPIIDSGHLSQLCIDKIYQQLPQEYQVQYGNGNGMISEQIVRAITARIISRIFGEMKGIELLSFDVSQGFAVEKAIYNLLMEEYEPNRDKYYTFSEFTERLISEIYKFRV